MGHNNAQPKNPELQQALFEVQISSEPKAAENRAHLGENVVRRVVVLVVLHFR